MTEVTQTGVPKIALICHRGALLDRELLPSWIVSWASLVGIIEIDERPGELLGRLKRELKRSGPLGVLDVLAFRAYYRLAWAARDMRWERETCTRLVTGLRPAPRDVPVVLVRNPNERDSYAALIEWAPDIVIARCKFLLKREVFEVPRFGTYVLHPGICPEYRNAHGCFWALANGDGRNVGATLLRIDEGIDTGPVYAYLRVAHDVRRESHVVVQHRAVLENLDLVRETLSAIVADRAVPLPTHGRLSRVWGQPRLSAYIRARVGA